MGDRDVDPQAVSERLRRANDRRDELVMCAEAVANLAKHRQIEAIHARLVRHDREIRRVLDTIVRRWTLLIPPRYISTGAADTPRAKQHLEHVVPSRVLVDRMIMEPSECRALLDTAVIIASVTPREHQRLGGIYTHHEDLYRRMLAADVSQLPMLGEERYFNSGIKLQPTSTLRRQAHRQRRAGIGAQALDRGTPAIDQRPVDGEQPRPCGHLLAGEALPGDRASLLILERKPKSGLLFDDIISEREQICRNSKIKSLCRFEIYHKLKPCRLFDR
jgi:hypothetical protein